MANSFFRGRRRDRDRHHRHRQEAGHRVPRDLRPPQSPHTYELPADFVEDLRADRDALDACNTGKHSDNLAGVESTSAIDTLLSQAQAIVTRLDAAIQNKYSRDPDKLAAWKSASRTERSAKKASAPATPPLAA